jgi:uncharacterized protein (DUF2237 family)
VQDQRTGAVGDEAVTAADYQVPAGLADIDAVVAVGGMANDPSTPIPEFGFPGLRPGDRWLPVCTPLAESTRGGPSALNHCTLTDRKRFAACHA